MKLKSLLIASIIFLSGIGVTHASTYMGAYDIATTTGFSSQYGYYYSSMGVAPNSFTAVSVSVYLVNYSGGAPTLQVTNAPVIGYTWGCAAVSNGTTYSNFTGWGTFPVDCSTYGTSVTPSLGTLYIALYGEGYYAGSNDGVIAFEFSDSSTYSGTPTTGTQTNTRFISLSPTEGTTTATTSIVGADVYANLNDFDPSTGGRLYGTFTQDSAFACINSGSVYDALATCTGANAPAPEIDVDFSTTSPNVLLSGEYDLSQSITFGGGGAWTGTYFIQQSSRPWYFLGLYTTYTTLVSTTTHFIVGALSPMDIARGEIASSSAIFASSTRNTIGDILASTTASLANACNIFSGFDIGNCLTLVVWPGQQAISDDFTIIQQTPPWGYIFRVVDILNATTTTTTLPTIDYTFASSSPMSVIGDIHFDPFGEIAQSGALINQMTSDRPDHATVWTIMMPIVNIFVYLVLFTMIVHDLTGIYSHDKSKNDKGDV